MQFEGLSVPAILLLAVTSLILVLWRDWRVCISALGAQYAGVFMLVGLSWPLEMAVIKLVTGWIAAAVLGMEFVSSPGEYLQEQPLRLSGKLFRIFLAALVGLSILSLAPQAETWNPQAAYHQILGCLILVGMGLLQLGISDNPFRITIGILTFLSGFEIIYASMETSTIVAGSFAVLSLGIALVGSYLMLAPGLEVGE